MGSNPTSPVPLADVTVSHLEILERANEVRKGEVMPSIETPKAQNICCIHGGIKIMLSVENIGDSKLTMQSDQLKIDLYSIHGFYRIDNVKQSCQFDGQESVGVMKAHGKLTLACEYMIGDSNLLALHYVAIGNLIDDGQQITLSAGPIHFTVACDSCE